MHFTLNTLKTHRAARKAVAVVAILGLFAMFLPVSPARAAAVTSFKDTLSTIATTANANHTISWVSPSGVANAATIVLTFPTGFSLTGIIEDDVDIAGSTEGELTTAADCTAAEDASVVISGQTVTFTLCTGDGGDFTGSETITVEIGTHATASGTGANQIDNQSTAQNTTDPKITITSGASDSGSLAVEIIADDSVSVTATVDPSVTFSISDVAVGFGVLDATQECWANGTPPAACDSTSEAAHTFSLGTNAVSGVALTYNGATLTASSGTISVATIAGDADGTPGTEQFAMGFDDNGSAFTFADTSAYDENSNNFKFVASSTLPVLSTSAPVASTTIDAHYITNISAATEAGAYSTSITYIATGTF
ncbi:MAG: hypothetical protein AAB515_01415 [Patescibacteria group bacterium]